MGLEGGVHLLKSDVDILVLKITLFFIVETYGQLKKVVFDD